jgi:hypothetical protein
MFVIRSQKVDEQAANEEGFGGQNEVGDGGYGESSEDHGLSSCLEHAEI